MMEFSKICFAIFATCLLLAQAAPLKKKDDASEVKAKKPAPAESSIEDALRALSQGTKAPLVNGVAYSESKIETETNVNGHKTGHTESETKITKPSGKVVADVKMNTNSKQDGDAKPEIESEIVVPDQDGKSESGRNPSVNPLDYSPRAVAEYLLTTGDYAGVMSGFQALVDSGKITSEAATLDIETVMSEYSELVNEMQEAERDEFPTYDDEPDIDPTTEELAELYLMNERLREEEELAEQMQEPVIDDYVPEVIEEEEPPMNEAELRQSLTNLIDRIYEDLEAGNQNVPVDSLTESTEDRRAETEITESPEEELEQQAAEEAEAKAETQALESLSAARKDELKADKKSAEKKNESAEKKSA